MTNETFPKHHSFYQSYLEMMEEARELNCSEARAFAREMRSEKFENAWQAVRKHCQGDVGQLCGVELYNDTIQQWAAILVDPTEPSMYRAQYYAANGFHGHACHRTAVTVLDELIREGFRTMDMGALERLSGTPEWAFGSDVAGIMQKVNCGQISFEEGDRIYEELLARMKSSLQEKSA